MADISYYKVFNNDNMVGLDLINTAKDSAQIKFPNIFHHKPRQIINY